MNKAEFRRLRDYLSVLLDIETRHGMRIDPQVCPPDDANQWFVLSGRNRPCSLTVYLWTGGPFPVYVKEHGALLAGIYWVPTVEPGENFVQRFGRHLIKWLKETYPQHFDGSISLEEEFFGRVL